MMGKGEYEASGVSTNNGAHARNKESQKSDLAADFNYEIKIFDREIECGRLCTKIRSCRPAFLLRCVVSASAGQDEKMLKGGLEQAVIEREDTKGFEILVIQEKNLKVLLMRTYSEIVLDLKNTEGQPICEGLLGRSRLVGLLTWKCPWKKERWASISGSRSQKALRRSRCECRLAVFLRSH